MSPEILFNLFLQEKRYICNLASKTIDFYSYSFKVFKLSEGLPFPINPKSTKAFLTASIIRMREEGKTAACCNAYIRGINPFLNWLFESGHLEEKLVLKKLKCPERSMKTFSDVQIQTILSYRPTSKSEKRLLALLILLTDTGLRINEALTLKRQQIDFDNLLLDVQGKGNKFRRIPFSVEARKVLFKHLRSHDFDLLFCTRNGTRLLYDNMRRDFNSLMSKLGISGVDGSFHAFRRYFVTYSIRKNVNPFLIQRMLGHTSLEMTNHYAKLETGDLSCAHVSAL
jgi:integrase/recombinase XerD